METESIVVPMFYDTYECEFGDGFYPLLLNEMNTLKPISISFKKINNIWTQVNKNCILGLDGSTGPDLLAYLNEKIGDNTAKQIYNAFNIQLYIFEKV
jgi:hypothetical protein